MEIENEMSSIQENLKGIDFALIRGFLNSEKSTESETELMDTESTKDHELTFQRY